MFLYTFLYLMKIVQLKFNQPGVRLRLLIRFLLTHLSSSDNRRQSGITAAGLWPGAVCPHLVCVCVMRLMGSTLFSLAGDSPLTICAAATSVSFTLAASSFVFLVLGVLMVTGDRVQDEP